MRKINVARLDRIVEYSMYVFIFLLPWQGRWIIKEGVLNKGPWEYGTISFYGTEALLLLAFLFFVTKKITSYGTTDRLFQKEKKLRPSLYLLLAGAIVLAGFISIYWAADKQLALFGWLRLVEGFILMLIIRQTEVSFKKIFITFILSGVLQSALLMYQISVQYVFPSTLLGIAEHAPSILGDAVVQSDTVRFLRGYGSFPHPNILGGFLSLGLVFLVTLQTFFFSPAQRKNILGTQFFWGSFILLSTGIFLTFSRASWVSLLCTLILFTTFLALSFLRRGNKSDSPKGSWPNLIRMGIVGLAVLTTCLVFLSDLTFTRLSTEKPLEKFSIEERVEGYKNFFSILKERFLVGTGVQQYTLFLHDEIEKNLPAAKYQPVHNLFLLALAEGGALGFFFLCIWFGSALKEMSRIFWNAAATPWFFGTSAAIIFILLSGFFDHYWWSLFPGQMMFWLVLSLWVKSREELL